MERLAASVERLRVARKAAEIALSCAIAANNERPFDACKAHDLHVEWTVQNDRYEAAGREVSVFAEIACESAGLLARGRA